MKKLTHIASKDRQCFTCLAVIRAGDKYRQYRERATSWHEAQHGGMYPIRHQCAACASRLPTPVEGNGGTVGRAIAETTRI